MGIMIDGNVKMLCDEIKLYTKLTGEDGTKVPIMKLEAYLDGYEKGKADKVAMLTEIQTEIEKIEVAKENAEIKAGECCMKGACIDLIQQKIDILNGGIEAESENI